MLEDKFHEHLTRVIIPGAIKISKKTQIPFLAAFVTVYLKWQEQHKFHERCVDCLAFKTIGEVTVCPACRG